MPLTLVLGPANAAKAGEVLGAYAAATRRGALLVVPTSVDAEHYTRELAAEGALLGSVLTFGGLAAEIARRAGFSAARITELQRERLLARAAQAARLERLAEASRSPGFLQATGELIAELERSLIEPARFAQALRLWAADDERRAGYGREIASLYFAYRDQLERTGRLDRELYAWRALDVLRAAPTRWGAAPVFFYGFDDLHGLQRDAIETLARHAGVEVTVSLTYEPGRFALAARAEAAEELRALATQVVDMPPVDTHYAPAARAVLHHLERRLFEPGATRVAAGATVRLLEAGGERAEAELLAAEVLTLREQGVPAEEIAVVLRSPGQGAGVLRHVFTQYGIPVAVEREVPLTHTALGHGLLALARCALLDEAHTPARELVDYLRTPGVCVRAELADALEAEVVRRNLATVAQAREHAARQPELERALSAVETLRGSEDTLSGVGLQARRLLAARGAGHAPILDADSALEARACTAVLTALDELQELEPTLGGAELVAMLERLPVAAGWPVRPGAVLISDPLSIRARRFRAVLVGGLQEGAFPLAGAPEPFLSDELRYELAVASGLRLRPREDALARERYLFYASVSRASEYLGLSYCSSDEEGNLALPSPFLHDVAALLDEEWWDRRRRRLLADVVWEPSEAPTPLERRRAYAAAGVGGAAGGAGVAGAGVRGAAGVAGEVRQLSAAALGRVRHSELLSAGALEKFADCPVKWLVESELQPEALEPTPENLVRGSFMHDVLERVLRGLGEAVTERTLPQAKQLLTQALRDVPEDLAPGASPGVRAAAVRMIEADLRRYLEHEARDGCDWQPARLEQRFGFEGEEDVLPVLQLVEGEERVAVRGVIDRIDVDPSGRRAIVRDYKSGAVRIDYGASRWSSEHRLQVPLYMIAVRDLLGLEPVAGFYQPLRAAELRARGAYLSDAEPGATVFAADGQTPEQLDELLDDARARAVALAARLRTGELQPCPATCSRDGCRHPGICRST